MPPTTLLDPTTLDFSRVVADIEAIRAQNPQRYHMEQLHGILYVDYSQNVIVGYRDIRDDEFWCSGHMPGYPIFPGVLMCEAAAQLACYYTKSLGVMGDGLLGLGGLENARFRYPVRPGDRLVLVGKGIRVDRRQTKFAVQGYVGSSMAFHVDVIGVPIPGKEHVNEAVTSTAIGG